MCRMLSCGSLRQIMNSGSYNFVKAVVAEGWGGLLNNSIKVLEIKGSVNNGMNTD